MKTFFLYFIIVFFLIVVSVGVRAFYMLQASRFDGHSIAISVVNNKKLISIINIDKDTNSVSILNIKDVGIDSKDTFNTLGVLAESTIYSSKFPQAGNISDILWEGQFNKNNLKSDLTLIDIIRLSVALNKLNANDIKILEISSDETQINIDKKIDNLLIDSKIVEENLSIQIINATDVSGLGQGIERVVLKRGGNVVSVVSSRSKLSRSKIQYHTNSYTAKKLHNLLKFDLEKMTEKSVGEIVILIGDDYKSRKSF